MRLQTLLACAVWLLALSVHSARAEDKEIAEKFHRILFLGNSITRHGPNQGIGWPGDWGMAASAEQKDFVHLVLAALSGKGENASDALIRNMAGFERNLATYDSKPLLKEIREFDPDLVIFAIGENVKKLDSAEAEKNFADSARHLLKSLQTDTGPVIVVRSCFWANEAKDRILRQVCEDVGGIFVDISHLDDEEANFARSEREFSHKGVAAHPGDRGMRAIADAILAALEKTKS